MFDTAHKFFAWKSFAWNGALPWLRLAAHRRAPARALEGSRNDRLESRRRDRPVALTP